MIEAPTAGSLTLGRLNRWCRETLGVVAQIGAVVFKIPMDR